MSLIHEALKRARGEAERQSDAERAGAAPAPAWTPPPFSRRQRSPVLSSVLASLAASTVVLGLGFYLQRARTKPAPLPPTDVASSASAATSAPTVNGAPAVSAIPAPSTAAPAVAPAPAATALQSLTVSARRPASAALRPASAGGAATPQPPTAAPARPDAVSSTTDTMTAKRPDAPRNGGLDGKSFVRQVTLSTGARLELGGIVSGTTPLAMLNGHVVGIGEYVEDCAVARVEPRRVQLHGADGTFWIELQ